MRGNFENSGKLAKFILRRERVSTSIWLAILLYLIIVVPILFAGMYSEDDIRGMAATMNNPAMIAMVGPVYGIEDYTIGKMNGNMMLLFTAVGVALMNMFLVVRHTRKDEERGRIEVIRSLPVGRLANLSSVLTVATGINLLLAIATTVGLTLIGIESIDFAGSLVYGASLFAIGVLFAGIAALFSQLSSNSRGASMYTGMVIGVGYVIRAVGDMNSELLSCISPLGLVLRVQLYDANYWWPVLILLLEAVIVTVISYYLDSIRDMDQGFIPAKPGRREASAALKSFGAPLLPTLGLSIRQLRVTFIGWTVGMITLGAAYGSVMGEFETFLSGNEILAQAFLADSPHSITEQFITMLIAIMAIFATIPVLSMILKLRSEEKRHFTEHILSRSVSRTAYMASYFIIAVFCSLFMLFTTIFGLWASSAAVMDNPMSFGSVLKSASVYLPAIWFMLGLAALLTGVLPNRSGLTWAYLGFAFFLIYIGKLMQFPSWTNKLSPFGFIPQLPIDSINYTTLIILTILSAILSVLGFVFYRRRDMA